MSMGLTAAQAVLLVGAAGAAASVYGANKQAGAAQDAATQNAQSQAMQNQSAWANYLMTRGVNPNGAATGQIPTNPQAINARLPLWATANFAAPGSAKGWRKKGSTGAAPNTLSMAPSYAPPAAPANDPAAMFG